MMLLFLSLAFSIAAQDTTDSPLIYENDTSTMTNRSVFYTELNNLLMLSFNYEIRQNTKINQGWGAKMGINFGGYVNYSDSFTGFPIGINYIKGKKNDGFLIGLGVSPTIIYRTFSTGFWSSSTRTDKSILNAYGEIGYRYSPDPHQKGSIIQMKFSPLIIEKQFTYAMSVGYGYAF
jgi:hypothetical protein